MISHVSNVLCANEFTTTHNYMKIMSLPAVAVKTKTVGDKFSNYPQKHSV